MKIFYLLLLIFVTSCTTEFKKEDLPQAENPDDSVLLLAGVNDPLEPFNRTMFSLNKGLFKYIIYPATEGYNYVMPEVARTGIRDFYENLLYPVRVVNNLAQTQWHEAWVETKRFGINTTVGFLGFTDPATDKYGLKLYDEDLGLTFGHYGWEPQMYIYLPIINASSERDLLGRIGDSFLDPATYYFPASPALAFNNLSFTAKGIYEVLKTQYDPYELNHLLYSVQRTAPKYAINMASDPASNSVQTIYATFVMPQNKDFIDEVEEGTIKLEGFREELNYNIWRNPEAKRTIYILPGLGEHRSSSRIQALAEIAYNQNYNVISFSNTFNWEFLKAAPKSFFAGYINDDLEKINLLIDAIEADLPELSDQKKSLMGMSLGAWYTLNLAALDNGKFDKFIVINPPVNLIEGLQVVDSLYRTPFNDRQKEDAIKVANVSSLKALAAITGGPRTSNQLPFTHDEASFLVGLNFRFTLRDALFAGQYDDLTGFYESRELIYDKLSSISFGDYFNKIVLPKLKERGISKEEVYKSSDIRNSSKSLKKADGLRVFLSANDFLLTPEYLGWFEDTLGDRVSINPTGGHLGNLVQPQVLKSIQESLK